MMTDFFDALTRAIRFARRLVLGCVSKAPATEGRLQ